jgi:hypothetical protein
MGNVIPAVCKRESSSFAPGCPIKTFGHDGKWMLMAHSAFALWAGTLFLQKSPTFFLTNVFTKTGSGIL